MILWCMRAANSAGAEATGEILLPRPSKHTHRQQTGQKDLQYVEAGPVPTKDKML